MNADILLNWSPLATGLLTNAGLPNAMTFENLVESDPTFIYNGTEGDFTHTEIVADQGSSPAFPFDVTINGSTSRPVGTKWLYFDLDDPGAAEYMWLTFHGGLDENWHNLVKAGFIRIQIGTIVNNVNYDLAQTNGPFSICQLSLFIAGSHTWKSHSQMAGGGSDNGATFPATSGTFFYQFFRDTTNSLHKIRWYDADNGFALVGESQSVLGDNLWSYRDEWENWYNGTQPAQDVQVWFGPTVYEYDPTDFIPMDVPGTIAVTNLNVTGTLRVG